MYSITLRFKFVKKDEFKYLSHLDLIRIISRAVARAGLKPVYSKGFNPKPKISFSNPTPLGIESFAEYCDIELINDVEAVKFTELMNGVLPEQIKIVEAKRIERKISSLMSEISLVLYEFNLKLLKSDNKSCLKIKKILSANNKSDGLIMLIEALEKDFGSEINKIPEIFKSMYSFNFDSTNNNVIVLKIFGYAKIMKDKDNLIFKLNSFLNFLNNFIEKHKMRLESLRKLEMYLNIDDKRITPLDAV